MAVNAHQHRSALAAAGVDRVPAMLRVIREHPPSVSTLPASHREPRAVLRDRWDGRSRGAQHVDFQHIVSQAHESPLALHLLQPAQEELPEPARMLCLSEHRFDDRLAPAGHVLPRLGLQFSAHPIRQRCALRQRVPQTRLREIHAGQQQQQVPPVIVTTPAVSAAGHAKVPRSSRLYRTR